MKRTKHYLIAFLCLLSVLALSLSLAACGIVKKEKFSVTIADYDTTNGKVTLSPEAEDGKYEKDTEITVTVEAYEGYALDTFTLSTDANAALDGEGKFVFNVIADTTITVTFKATTVPVESVTLGSNTLELEVGGRTEDATATLVANVQPDNATDKTVTWTSSNPAVATVEGGNVTALTAGETTITATAGGKSATCTVTVTQHTHTIDTEKGLQNDETSHWHVCKTCGEKMDEATHSLKINEAKTAFKCEQCEYEVAHTHDTELRNTGDDGHKTVCKTEGCGYESAVTAHAAAEGAQWKQDTENNQHYKECVCGAHVEVASHTAKDDEWLKNEDNTKHYQLCICGEKVNEAEHTAKDDQWHQDAEKGEHYKECVCGEHVEVASHTAKDDQWHQDAEKGEHYKECVCGEHVEVAAHYNEDDEYVSDGATGHHQVCTACEASFNQGQHELDSEYTSEQGGHYQECLDCDYHTDLVPHTNPNPGGKYTWYKDEDNGYYHGFDCSTCEYAVRIDHSNSYKQDYTQDDGEYRYCDECEYREKIKNHSLNNITSNSNGTHNVACSNLLCTYKKENVTCSMTWTTLEDAVSGHKGECSECHYTVEREDHVFNTDKECSKCGYKDTGEHTCKDEPVNGFYDGLCDTCGKIIDNFWTVSSAGQITAYGGTQAKVIVPAQYESSKSIVSFTKDVFGDNATVTDVIISNGVSFPQSYGFANCTNLESVVILNESAKSLPSLFFSGCAKLKSIVLPSSITEIKVAAFGPDSRNSNGFAESLTIYYLGQANSLKKTTSNTTYSKANEFLTNATVLSYNKDGQASAKSTEWHWKTTDESGKVIPEGILPEAWKQVVS